MHAQYIKMACVHENKSLKLTIKKKIIFKKLHSHKLGKMSIFFYPNKIFFFKSKAEKV